MPSNLNPEERVPIVRVLSSIRTGSYGIIGRVLNFFRVPGHIQPIDFEDGVLGKRICVSNSGFYTKVSIGNRDLFFNRISGKFDGTGGTVPAGEVSTE